MFATIWAALFEPRHPRGYTGKHRAPRRLPALVPARIAVARVTPSPIRRPA